MNAQVSVLMLWGEILGIPVVVIFFVVVAIIVMAQYIQDKNQKRTQEKVTELTEKGHDAKLCPKCKGKGGRTWGEWANCPECGGLGYIFKLRESEESQTNADDKGGLQKCENCGAMIGKLEESYVFEDHVVCYKCHQKLKNHKSKYCQK